MRAVAGVGPGQDLVNYFTYQSRYQQDVGVPALTKLLKAGYVVAATDYQGLGTPGAAQYAVSSAQSAERLRLGARGSGDRAGGRR